MSEKKKKKRYVKIKIGDDFYAYKGGVYVREKLGNDRGCKEYRIKDIKPGRKLLICIKDKEGKRGGKTKAISLLRKIDIDLREYKGKEESKIKKAIKKFRELKEKMKKKEKIKCFSLLKNLSLQILKFYNRVQRFFFPYLFLS